MTSVAHPPPKGGTQPPPTTTLIEIIILRAVSCLRVSSIPLSNVKGLVRDLMSALGDLRPNTMVAFLRLLCVFLIEFQICVGG